MRAEPSATEHLGTPVTAAFFDRSALDVARELLGGTLSYRGVGGQIVETESYLESDPACHAHVGVTARTSTLFARPGIAYVYLSYGIHALLNFVTEPQGEAGAVLIRALRPLWGLDQMRRRRSVEADRELCSGPGKLTQALGVTLADNERALDAEPFSIHAPSPRAKRAATLTGPRIGITKGAELPWRYCLSGEPDVSRPRPPGWPRVSSRAGALRG